MAVDDLREDGVRVPEAGTPSPDTWSVLKPALGYPPVLGVMLLIDALASLVTGSQVSVSLGEAVAYALLPPVAMLLVGLGESGRPSRVRLIGAGVAAVAALFAALYLGGGIRLASVPAWVAAAAATVLLAATVLVFAPRRQHVGRRRA